MIASVKKILYYDLPLIFSTMTLYSGILLMKLQSLDFAECL